MKLASIRLADAWDLLGGGPLRGNRGRAFWRDGDGYSISLNLDRGTWFDFRDGLGGGVLALVEVALNCDRASAIVWLKTNCGLDSQGPRASEQRRAAKSFAARVANWSHGKMQALEAAKVAAIRAADDSSLESAASRLWAIERACGAELVAAFRQDPEAAKYEDSGGADADNAERITGLLVALLVKACGGRLRHEPRI